MNGRPCDVGADGDEYGRVSGDGRKFAWPE